ncbi:MAG: endo alpha-1,4 polygalactosaminidase [Mycobacterium sp.]
MLQLSYWRSLTMVARALLVATILVAGCTAHPRTAAEPGGTQPDGPQPTVELRPPPVTGSFDYQLGGVYAIPGLAVVVRDATEHPLPGAYNICYVNGFQTQPGDGERWLQQHPTAVLRTPDGAPVSDPDWPDEYVLDPSTAPQRAIILDVLGPVFSECAAKGYNAVEVDNLDTFTRFPGRIDEAGAIELARSFVTMAHDHRLAIGQKNAAETTDRGRHEVGFDFAVAEECAAYDECGRYAEAYGPHVLQIEYTDNLPAPFADVCASSDRAPMTILRDRLLVARGAAGYAYEQC